jgi:hypothetical protein
LEKGKVERKLLRGENMPEDQFSDSYEVLKFKEEN